MIYFVDEELLKEKAPSELELKNLNNENQKHLKALRPDAGEEIAFLDLKGNAALYHVEKAKPLVMSFSKMIHIKDSSTKTHLYLAPPSDSALEQAIEQATEVGYDFIHFLRSERVQYPKGKSIPFSRLKRVIQASCKQCGRLWAPTLDENFHSVNAALEKVAGDLVICADEGAARNSWGSLKGSLPSDIPNIAIFIGPEGGWSDEERKTLHGAARVFSLGPHVLRVPTAVVSAYALCWKELSRG